MFPRSFLCTVLTGILLSVLPFFAAIELVYLQSMETGRCFMKLSLRFTLVLFALFLPSLASAQHTARIECARNDGYVYLYSSVITLDVRGTLQCGEIVQVIGRDETYLAVRTAKGESGFVPMASAAILKDRAAAAA